MMLGDDFTKDAYERLRVKLGELRIPNGQQAPIQITVSIGVAQLGHFDLEDVLKDADRALYLAKNSGRNQVQLMPLPEPSDPSAEPGRRASA